MTRSLHIFTDWPALRQVTAETHLKVKRNNRENIKKAASRHMVVELKLFTLI